METVDVEAAIDKALEVAVEEFRDALVSLGRDAVDEELSFWEVEKEFGIALMTFAQRMLAVTLQLYDHGAKYVEHDDTIWRRGTRKRTKTYHSVWGPIECERWVYRERGEASGPQLVPLEERAGLVGDQWTPHCAEAIARMVQSVPTREAVDNMETVGVLPYTRSGFDNVVERVGEQWEADRHAIEQEVVEAVEVPEEAVGISVAYDRVRIDMDETVLDPDEWPNGRKQPREIHGRMAYCATVTLHGDQGEALWTNRYGRVAAQPEEGDVPGVGEWKIREKVKWDVESILDEAPELADRAVALCDGGSELESILEEDFPDWTQLCDVRHLGAYLDGALEANGDDEDLVERKHKRREWIEHLKHEDDGIEDIEGELESWRDGGGDGVDDALTYIDNRRDRLTDYAEAHRQGLPIGSGHVEATCKSLVEMRMRRCGARWTQSAAQTMLDIRALALSKTWSEGMEAVLSRFRDQSIERCDELCEKKAA